MSVFLYCKTRDNRQSQSGQSSLPNKILQGQNSRIKRGRGWWGLWGGCNYLIFMKNSYERGASNEYPQHMYSSRNKKNIIWIPPLICSYAISYLMTEIQIWHFFQPNSIDIFLISPWKHMLWGHIRSASSNIYPQHIFSWRNKKNMSMIPLSSGAMSKELSHFSEMNLFNFPNKCFHWQARKISWFFDPQVIAHLKC